MSWCDNLSIFTWLISWDTKALTVFIYSTTNESGIYFTPNYVAKLPIKLNCILYIYFCSYSNNRKVTVIVSFSFERRTQFLYFSSLSLISTFLFYSKSYQSHSKRKGEVDWAQTKMWNGCNLASFCKGFSQKKKIL